MIFYLVIKVKSVVTDNKMYFRNIKEMKIYGTKW